MTIIRMASTFASTGRSMKNFEIMAGPSTRAACRHGGGGLDLRIDLLARDRPQQAVDDHAVVLVEPLLDHPHGTDQRSDLDLALLDLVAGVDHQYVEAALVAAERNLGHQQCVLRLAPRDAHA